MNKTKNNIIIFIYEERGKSKNIIFLRDREDIDIEVI